MQLSGRPLEPNRNLARRLTSLNGLSIASWNVKPDSPYGQYVAPSFPAESDIPTARFGDRSPLIGVLPLSKARDPQSRAQTTKVARRD